VVALREGGDYFWCLRDDAGSSVFRYRTSWLFELPLGMEIVPEMLSSIIVRSIILTVSQGATVLEPGQGLTARHSAGSSRTWSAGLQGFALISRGPVPRLNQQLLPHTRIQRLLSHEGRPPTLSPCHEVSRNPRMIAV
jgi:hypothetical protein